jgi:hypothetical protein
MSPLTRLEKEAIHLKWEAIKYFLKFDDLNSTTLIKEQGTMNQMMEITITMEKEYLIRTTQMARKDYIRTRDRMTISR